MKIQKDYFKVRLHYQNSDNWAETKIKFKDLGAAFYLFQSMIIDPKCEVVLFEILDSKNQVLECLGIPGTRNAVIDSMKGKKNEKQRSKTKNKTNRSASNRRTRK